MRKQIIIASCILVFILVLSPFILHHKKDLESEQTITGTVILNINHVRYPIVNEVEVEIYYKEKKCLMKQKEIFKKFNNIRIITESNIERISQEKKDYLTLLGIAEDSPILIFKGIGTEVTLIVSGEVACSEKLISYNLCKFLGTNLEMCNSVAVIEKKLGQMQIIESDSLCYGCCSILYKEEDSIIVRGVCGPICGFVSGYVEGESTTISRKCQGKNCDTDAYDKACCKKDSCVYQSICYKEFDLVDVGSDGRKEICFDIGNDSYVWVDPDNSRYACKNDDLRWFDQASDSSNSFIFAFFNLFIRQKDGFCCGDDKDEYPTECRGFVCNATKNNDFVCCKRNQCSYDGKCYPSGCNEVKTNKSRIKLYCKGETGQWQDLDELHCKDCLGKDSWSGSICCGDDHNEGSYAKDFVYQEEDKLSINYSMCSNRKSDCVHPLIKEPFREGCYDFGEKYEYLEGDYYCNNGVWYDPDYRKDYCTKCKLDWNKNKDSCCGDDKGEYFIEGEDGTEACCDSYSYCVKNGECVKCENCGNGVIDQSEKCESPNTFNNFYCNQSTSECLNNKSGIRDSHGNCNEICSCVYDEFNYSCVKSECGAECNEDGTGCKEGQICNTLYCSCYDEPKKNATKEVSKEIDCPYVVDVSFDKEEYFTGDNANITIVVFDKNKDLMPSVKFFLEFYINEELKSMTLYSTEKDGFYRINKFVTNSTNPGIYSYIAKVYHRDCEVIGDSAEAKFTVSKEKVAAKKILKNTKSARKITVNLTEFNPPLVLTTGFCGDGTLNIGEVCEDNKVCRNSVGCDYKNRVYDIEDHCNNCECSSDKKSEANGKEYCENCNHCGDGIVNCGEECEQDEVEEMLCQNGRIYERTYFCSDCKWTYNTTTDIIIKDCWCDCPTKIEKDCVDGDYILYNKDHNSGCSNEDCNECICQDTYKKDSNNDGIEDKCSPEICNNNFDDNDNGLIDEEGCLWYFCSDCGHGTFNLCDKEECLTYKED